MTIVRRCWRLASPARTTGAEYPTDARTAGTRPAGPERPLSSRAYRVRCGASPLEDFRFRRCGYSSERRMWPAVSSCRTPWRWTECEVFAQYDTAPSELQTMWRSRHVTTDNQSDASSLFPAFRLIIPSFTSMCCVCSCLLFFLPTILVVQVRQMVWCVCPDYDIWSKWPLRYKFGMLIHLDTISVTFEGQAQGHRRKTRAQQLLWQPEKQIWISNCK